MLAHDLLIELFDYDPKTGWFINRITRGPARKGKRAGSISHSRYRRIVIGQHRYYEHHLAWFYIYREWPDELDHIDGDPSNNAIANLRLCNRAQNNCNTQSLTGESGLRGAYLDHRSLKWYSKIQFGGQVTYLGSFDTLEEANAAFERAAKQLHGEFYVEPQL